MNTKLLFLPALVMGACATAKPLPRSGLAPASATEATRFEPDRVRTEAAERSAPPVVRPPTPEPNAARPAAPVYRSFVERVEVPVERVVEVAPPARTYDVYVEDPSRRSAPRRRASNPFPVQTAIGAGVGAVLGHQAGRRDAGALIGGGIGLLFDLGRWSR